MARSQRPIRKNTSLKPTGHSQIESEYQSIIARAFLLAASSLAASSGGRIGRRRLINFLRGNEFPRSGEVLEGFGLLQGQSASWVAEVIDRLVEEGYLTLTQGFGSAKLVALGSTGKSALKPGTAFPVDILPSRPRLGTNPEVEERLRKLRLELSVLEKRAPYGIFPNLVLADLAAKRPRSLAELAEISGFGETRIRKYGRKILAAVKED